MMSGILTKSSKVEKILKGGLDSIPSPSPSVKIQIIGGIVYSLINMRQLLILFISAKLDIGLLVDLAEFPCFYAVLA